MLIGRPIYYMCSTVKGVTGQMQASLSVDQWPSKLQALRTITWLRFISGDCLQYYFFTLFTTGSGVPMVARMSTSFAEQLTTLAGIHVSTDRQGNS